MNRVACVRSVRVHSGPESVAVDAHGAPGLVVAARAGFPCPVIEVRVVVGHPAARRDSACSHPVDRHVRVGGPRQGVGSGIDRFGADQRLEVVGVGPHGGHARRCAGADEGVVGGDIGRGRVPGRRADEDQPELLPGADVSRLQRPIGRHHFGLGLRGRGQGQQRGGGQQGQAGPRAGAVRSLPGLATAPGSRKSPCPGGDDTRF